MGKLLFGSDRTGVQRTHRQHRGFHQPGDIRDLSDQPPAELARDLVAEGWLQEGVLERADAVVADARCAEALEEQPECRGFFGGTTGKRANFRKRLTRAGSSLAVSIGSESQI